MNGMHGIIFSYGKENGLRELIENRVHGSIPFGGDYRIIDFILSSMVNAGVTDVGVIMHGKCQSLLDHLGSGKSWDLSRNFGGLTLLPAFAYNEQHRGDGKFRGRVDALGSVMNYLKGIRQDYVVLTEGDLVANLPLQEILEEHIRSGADITAVCADDASPVENGAYFELEEDGRVRQILVQPHQPRGKRSLETYLLSRDLLLKLVDDCASRDLTSFRRDVLQARREEMDIRGWVFRGFAAQMRSVRDYYERSMQLLNRDVRRDLFCPERPVRAKSADKSSAYLSPEAVCRNSLIADGCKIEGTVEDSILFPGVTVESGATVKGCILFKETIVRRDASLRCVITDKRVQVQNGRRLAGHETYPLVIAKGRVV